MHKITTLITIFLALTMTFAFAAENRNAVPDGENQFRQAFTERAPGRFDAAAYLNSQQEAYGWLLAEAPMLQARSLITIDVTQADLQAIEEAPCDTCGGLQAVNRKLRVGLVKQVQHRLSGKHLEEMPDGGYSWLAAAESKNAAAMRIHFSDFDLPENTVLYIYNMEGQVFGPYTGQGPSGDGEFWTHTLSGNFAYVQLRQFGPAPEEQNPRFVIDAVGHLTPKFLLPFLQNPDTPPTQEEMARILEFCSFNEPCIEDASCYNNSAVNDAKDAVAHMQWISGPWIYMCSGGLMADTDDSSQIPYFLTANHCISKSKDAAALECYFQFKTSSCGGDCYDPVGAVPRTLGADVLSSNRSSDYTLMQLWEAAPSGSAFLGWTSAPVAYSNGADLYRISHPMGAPQAYSYHQVDTSAGVCSSWPRGDWIYSRDIVGATEGGSSGSPVVNSSGQVVGQLSGGCGTNVGDVCDSENNATVDGAFAAYFANVSQWLDPPVNGDKIHVHAIDLSTKVKGPKTDAIAKVTIVDEYGSPVEGAVVTGTFTGDVNDTSSDATDSKGVALLTIQVQGSVSSFTFCVDNVTHSSYTYDSSANVETCDTY